MKAAADKAAVDEAAAAQAAAEKAAAKEAAAEKAAAKKEQVVYITKTGSKYHAAGCQYLRQSKIAVSLSEAQATCTACSRCNP